MSSLGIGGLSAVVVAISHHSLCPNSMSLGMLLKDTGTRSLKSLELTSEISTAVRMEMLEVPTAVTPSSYLT